MVVILYDKNTGEIKLPSYKTNQRMLDKMLKRFPNYGYMLGRVANNKFQVNVSGDEHYIEAKPEVVINVPGWIRDHRWKRLKDSDWAVGSDSPLSEEKKAEWRTYRQALRDLPDQYVGQTDPNNVIWPTPPSK